MAVVGIDLGTTNTVVGVVADGQARTLCDDDGMTLIPSVVSFHPGGSVLVGRAARDRRLTDAGNTVYSIKRLIGRSWSSDEVSHARKRFPFEMREGPGQAALVVARGETFTLPEISAFVLRHAKSLAEKALGEPVERAVITVPANFNDLQRAATKVAGRVAGLEVLRILNEPTAAALAYGYGRGKAERVAIYDFGGGTFDVTLLDLSGNVFEVLATAGNTFLGGDDIDLAIAERMAEACLAEHRLDAREAPQIFERLRVAAERMKVALSASPEHTERIEELSYGARGRAVDFSFSMTRGELDALASPIVEQTFEVCRSALGIARLDPDDFDQVVLVGGSTRLPLVIQRVREFFGRSPLDRISPDEVVAIGAAIQANALGSPHRRRSSVPRPPMPAARTTESTVGPHPASSGKSQPPPLPQRKTDPFGHQRSSPPRAHMPTMLGVAPPADENGGPRRRRTTGLGLGPAPAPPGEAPRPRPPLPRRKGGTASGLGPPRAPKQPPRSPDPRGREEEADADLSSAGDRPALGLPAVGPDGRPGSATPEHHDAFGSLDLAPEPDDESTIVEPLAPYAQAEALETGTPRKDAADAGASPLDSVPAPDLARADSLRPEALESDRPQVTAEPALPSIRPSSAPQESFGSVDGLDNLQPPATAADELFAPAGGAFAPAEPAPHQIAAPQAPPERPPLPLLVDVTPLSLCVETVGDYCDVIIARNTPVPCEQSRGFVTARDDQTHVTVRVGQGDAVRFSENTLLGALELDGLPAAARGQSKVVVTFALDTDGILDVRAADAATGRETSARLTLVGLPETDEIDSMVQKHAAHPMIT